MFTYVTGNLAAAFLIKKFSMTLFYCIMTVICVISTIYFMFLPTPKPVVETMSVIGDEKEPLNAT